MLFWLLKDLSLVVLPVLVQDTLDVFVRLVDLGAGLCSGEHYLTTCKDEEHDLRVKHSEDKAREELWLVPTELYCVVVERL